jgi:hypothetical protein
MHRGQWQWPQQCIWASRECREGLSWHDEGNRRQLLAPAMMKPCMRVLTPAFMEKMVCEKM